MKPPSEVLEFWFGTLSADGRASEEKTKRWWSKSEAFDSEVRKSFEETLLGLSEAPDIDEWHTGETMRSFALVAAIVLTDQMSRNMYRGSSRMYAWDDLALRWSYELLALRHYEDLPFAYRIAIYMPLMHAEDRKAQETCCALFEELAADMAGVRAKKCEEIARGNLKYAVMHREIVDRFGRFPHRNRLLKRDSTDEEEAFLKLPGSSF